MSKKDKILFVAPLPPPFSGPEISAKMFIESRVKDFFKIIVLNTNFRISNKQKGHFDIKMIKAFFILNFKFLKLIITSRPQIVYLYVTATILGWIGRDIWIILWSRLFGAKIVIHMRAGHFRLNFNKTNQFFKIVIKNVLKLVTLNLVQSKSLMIQFSGLVPSKKIHYIYNMIDTEYFINRNYLEYDENMIFFLGHLSHAKGYCDILSIIPEIAEEFPSIKFYFAGTKINNETNISSNLINNEKINFKNPDLMYDEHIKDKYDSNYHYLGQLDEKSKIKYMKKANLFLMPSYSEGFSMSILEALSLAKTIITTRVGALGDIMKNNSNAIFIDPGDKTQLREAILFLLKNRSVRNEIATNNSKHSKNFSIKKIENQYIEIFKGIL